MHPNKKRNKSPYQNSEMKLFKRDIYRTICPQELLVKLTRNTEIEQLLKQYEHLKNRDIYRKICPQELLVKLTRNTEIEQLLKQYEHSKNMIVEWPGWETPNFRLLKTKQHLQQLIGKIKLPLHDVLPTQGKQHRVEQNGSQYNTNISTELEVNDAECLQEYSCFCGFDHDPMMGPFRGWEKVNTKDRDYFNQLVRLMQMNLCLDNVLDEVTIWPFNEGKKSSENNGRISETDENTTFIEGKKSNENNGRISESDENTTFIELNSPSLVVRKRHCGDNFKTPYKKSSVLELPRYDYSGKFNNQSATHSDNESVTTDSGTYCTDPFDLQPWQETSIPKKCSDGCQQFHCQDCDSRFVCLFYLKHHECSEYSTISEYPCYICHSKFSDKDKFSYHLKFAHKGVVNKHTTSSTCWTIKHCSVIDTNCPLRCSICSAEFPNKELLETHIKYMQF